MPQLAHGRQDLVLGIAAPERVLGLQRGDRMDRMRAADRLRRRFGQAEVADLAGADEIGHRADRLLDRRRAVDAMLVVEIDVIDAEALQRRVARLAHVVGLPADAEERAVVAAHVAELRRQHDLVAAVADGAADQLLVRERAVHVGRVEKVAAEVERAMDRGDRLRVIVGAVELRHPHAAEADGGDGERLAERAFLQLRRS